MIGAVFERELRALPRSRGLAVARAVYAGALLAIVATCWLVVTGSQAVTTAGDTARFGATLLRILAPLQLAERDNHNVLLRQQLVMLQQAVATVVGNATAAGAAAASSQQ